MQNGRMRRDHRGDEEKNQDSATNVSVTQLSTSKTASSLTSLPARTFVLLNPTQRISCDGLMHRTNRRKIMYLSLSPTSS